MSARRRGALARITLAVMSVGYTNVDVRLGRLGGFWPSASVTMDRDGERFGSTWESTTWHRLARYYEQTYDPFASGRPS